MAITIQQLEFGLADMRSKYQHAAGQLEMLQGQHEETVLALSIARQDIEVYEQVQVLFTKASEFAREQLKARIEQTVTAALQAIFCNSDIAFQIDIDTRSGKPTADWQVVSKYGDAVVQANPEDARGGGVTDVVSMALRLALIELARPRVEGPILLDEPGKMVSREYLPNLAEFLKQYLAKTGRQGIMITHAEPLAEVADLTYRVRQEKGESEVSKDG